jgi:hypothetical protein
MPIRFRCAYCNQLLGIARRKAGTVVRCPGCSGQVVVPSLEEAGLAEKPAPKPGAAASPFEGNDIDKMLEGAAGEQPSVIQPGPGPVFASQAAGGPTAVRPTGSVGPSAMPQPGGIVLSQNKATLISVAVVIGLAVMFGLGLIVGAWLKR